MKNNISYYPHECAASGHDKFIVLRAKYGWEGEGKFWALNGFIGEADGCLLNITIVRKKAKICDALNFTLKQFDEFIEYLITDCELIYRKGDCITNKTCQEALVEVNRIRDKDRRRKDKTFQSGKEEIPRGKSNIPDGKPQIPLRKDSLSGEKETKEKNKRNARDESQSGESEALPPERDPTPEEVAAILASTKRVRIPDSG